MINQTYVKHFPAEYHSQSAIEAALELREQIGADNIDQKIESITIESFDAAVDIIAGFAEHWAPKSRETADHSMPYCVSAALIDGDITLDTFSDARIQEPKLRALIQKVKVNRNAEMTAGYPDGIPNLLVIKTTDGKEYSKKVSYPLGHSRNPMNDVDIEQKFRPLALRWMSEQNVERLLKALWDIENCQNISEIMQLFADCIAVGKSGK
jgi:2-methylcitrate dehydratase